MRSDARFLARALIAFVVGLAAAAAGPYDEVARLAWERALEALPPAPDMSPPRTGTGLYVIVIEGEGERPVWAARVLTDRALWRTLEYQGHRWRIIPYSDPVAVARGYSKLADRVDKPALLIFSDVGVPKGVQTLPMTAEGVRNAVKEAQR